MQARHTQIFEGQNSFPLGDLDGLAKKFLGLIGDEPYKTILAARFGTNYDYVWNHTDGPDWAKTLAAQNAASFPGISTFEPHLLAFDGAITLYDVYQKIATSGGGEIDFQHDPEKTNQIINSIVDRTGIVPEIVWGFFTHLYHEAEDRGLVQIIKPQTYKDMGGGQNPLISTPQLFGGIGVTIALVLAGLYVFNRVTSVGK